MLSTGNDIVSLHAIDVARTKQPNFYSKILSPAETALYSATGLSAIPFEVFVWLLWSIKESAFKYLQRINADILFTPVKFEVSEIHIPAEFNQQTFDKTELTGIGFDGLNTIQTTIKFNGYTLFSNSLVYKEFIASVINDSKDFDQTYWGIKKIERNENEIQSAQVRKFLIDNFPGKNITISKNPKGIPILLKAIMELPSPVSLAHHDKFISYSFIIP